MTIREPHSFPGRLIVVEGIDGSGKSTQISLLQTFLQSEGYDVSYTEWNSSPLVKDTTKRGKKKNLFTPTTFSLIHATDFADRHERSILTPLQAGLIVLADRYAYTAFARDVARGVHPDWVRAVYSFAMRPDLTFYFRVPIEVSLQRLLTGRTKLKYHEAGMDVGLAPDPVDSFRLFQSRVLDNYDKVTAEFGLRVIDATTDIPTQQKIVRREVDKTLAGYDGPRVEKPQNARPRREAR
jgi:dTMP kinase